MLKHHKKPRGTKVALLISLATLLLCSATLVSSTYAWFTDTAAASNNQIVAGNLDVDIGLWNGEGGTEFDADPSHYVSIADKENAIFAEEKWYPGKTQVVYLAIKNTGNLALKCNMALQTIDADGDANLYEVMEYEVIENRNHTQPLKAEEWNTTGIGKPVTLGTHVVPNWEGHLKVGDVTYVAFVMHMDKEEGADSKYMNGKVQFKLIVNATQYPLEKDSFDNQYDKDLPLPNDATITDWPSNT